MSLSFIFQVILASPLHLSTSSRKNESSKQNRASSSSATGEKERKSKSKSSKRSAVGGRNEKNKDVAEAWPALYSYSQNMANSASNSSPFIQTPAAAATAEESAASAGAAAAAAVAKIQQQSQQQQQQQQQQQSSSTVEKESFYQLCDMCGHYFQHPVTYHMKLAHPGCSSPAGGKGYNSGGNYCGGWAGNCGDGGSGGASWYLICEKCRDEQMKNVSSALPPPPSMRGGDLDGSKSKSVKLRRKPFSMLMMQSSSKMSLSPSAVGQQMNSHIIMNNNAMFLLDLASASNSNLIPPTSLKPQQAQASASAQPTSSASMAPVVGGARSKITPNSATSSHLSSVSELSQLDPNPFPFIPFQCFNALGVQDSHLKLINDELLLDDALKNPERSGNEDAILPKEEGKISPPEQFREKEEDDINTSPSRRAFSRSVSIGGKDWNKAAAMASKDAANGVADKKAKRNSSYMEQASNGFPPQQFLAKPSPDFLSNPSPALHKLFSPSHLGDILQRPVMSFVLQWNDLESLQIAMTMALRKAACRTFAVQALTWLLRSVSQPACLHDLLWWFVAALEAQLFDPVVSPTSAALSAAEAVVARAVASVAAEEKNGKDRKNRKNAQQQAGGGANLKGNALAAGGGGPDKQASGSNSVSPSLHEASPALGQKSRDSQSGLCEHPTSDIYIAGSAIQPLPDTFHNLLQTISDLMLLLPVGSSLQQIAIRCWGIKFKPADHQFLHQSHVFSTISRILSRSEELDNTAPGLVNPGSQQSHQVHSVSIGGVVGPGSNAQSFYDSEGMVEQVS